MLTHKCEKEITEHPHKSHPRGKIFHRQEDRLMRKFVAAAVLCVLPVCAQTLGEITGEVRDPSGGLVVGATVAASNRATGANRTALTNEAGIYSFPALQPGMYDLKVEMTGFRVVT